MDCVYQVNEMIGSYGYQRRYLERVNQSGKRSRFFCGDTAFIDYYVYPLVNAKGFYIQYEVSSATGEVLVLGSHSAKHESELDAKIHAIEAAKTAVTKYDGEVTCKIGDKKAEEVIEELLKERENDESDE